MRINETRPGESLKQNKNSNSLVLITTQARQWVNNVANVIDSVNDFVGFDLTTRHIQFADEHHIPYDSPVVWVWHVHVDLFRKILQQEKAQNLACKWVFASSFH